MTEVNINIFRDDNTLFFEGVEAGQYFLHKGALFVKIDEFGGDDDFIANAVDLKNGMLWNFEGHDTVEICARVDIAVFMDPRRIYGN